MEPVISEEELRKLVFSLSERYYEAEEQVKVALRELEGARCEIDDALRPLIKHYYELVRGSEQKVRE